MNKSGNNPVIATPLSPDQGVDIMKLSVAIADRMDMDVKVVHRIITVMMETLESEAFWRCIDDDADDADDDDADDAVDDSDIRPATANEYELESMEDSYSHIAPGGFGTGDLVLAGKDENGKGLIHVVDFKGGRGVKVDNSREHPNSQMMLYAIAALKAYSWLVDVEIVRMTIIQPRLDNYPTCQLTVNELNAWAESIKPIARMAFEGIGEQNPGDWCMFCKAKAVCRACADEALALAREEFTDLDDETEAIDSGHEGAVSGSKEGEPEAVEQEAAEPSDLTEPYDIDRQTVAFKSPNLVPIAELAGMLPTLNRIASWIEAVFAFVSEEAITHGAVIPGYKVVEGRARRVFSDAEAAAKAAECAGVTNIYKTELKSLAEIEKMMGKKRFAEVLGDYVIKPPGKLSLVEESDPRPAVNTGSTDEFEVLG